MKTCPIALQICQNKLKILPNTKWTLSKWPKCFNIVPKWHTGHTGRRSEQEEEDCNADDCCMQLGGLPLQLLSERLTTSDE